MKIYSEKYKFYKMNFLFGKKKSVAPAPSKAIDKLRESLEMLEKRETFLETQITLLKGQAVKYLHEKNKTKALSQLKKCKLWEKEIDSISGQKFNLETQISALTQAIVNSETMQAMRMGRETLANLDAKLDPDKVANVMDDLTENLAKVGEVTDAMARPIGPLLDDDELLKELDDLSLEKEVLVTPEPHTTPLDLPNVPDDQDEEELRKLENIMNA